MKKLESLSLDKFQSIAISDFGRLVSAKGGAISMSSDTRGHSDEADLSNSGGDVIATDVDDLPDPIPGSGNQWDNAKWI